MMRYPLVAFLLIICLVGCGASSSSSRRGRSSSTNRDREPAATTSSQTGGNRRPTPTTTRTNNPKVRQIVDGDTVTLDDGRTVRLLGINTPEQDQPFYTEARQFTSNLLAGVVVRLEFDVEREDDFGRTLAHLFLPDGRHANLEIVRQGYAQALTVPPNVKYADQFAAAEREAREQGRGLWASSNVSLEIVAMEPNPPGPDEENINGETVTIQNTGSQSINLDGFQMSDRGNHTFRFPRLSLPPGKQVILYSGAGRNSDSALYWNADTPIWSNSGDAAFLRDAQGNLIDVYEHP